MFIFSRVMYYQVFVFFAGLPLAIGFLAKSQLSLNTPVTIIIPMYAKTLA